MKNMYKIIPITLTLLLSYHTKITAKSNINLINRTGKPVTLKIDYVNSKKTWRNLLGKKKSKTTKESGVKMGDAIPTTADKLLTGLKVAGVVMSAIAETSAATQGGVSGMVARHQTKGSTTAAVKSLEQDEIKSKTTGKSVTITVPAGKDATIPCDMPAAATRSYENFFKITLTSSPAPKGEIRFSFVKVPLKTTAKNLGAKGTWKVDEVNIAIDAKIKGKHITYIFTPKK